MGYRFYRRDQYDNKIYQTVWVDVKKCGEYRIPVMMDARIDSDITVFPVNCELAYFIADWLGLYFEEVKE